MTRQENVIWGAGFFDGEGAISICRGTARTGRDTFFLQIIVSQKVKPPLSLLCKLFGGKIYTCNTAFGPVYQWAITGWKAYDFLVEVFPYLKVKKKQAQVAMRFQKGKRRDTSDRSRLSDQRIQLERNFYFELSALNQRRVRL